ncbi:alkylated DNA nucleotide flippase Atl1 [Nocardioides daedukensis]|uniref:Alkylated DNA nucleotide flippase Atl1 n=1 Tax=Nocardioides daedukensis TaxID=634462 RepID=A0A7Y9URL5_9ACTN|nr:MGMT family protein [Nocardioides daedukensis]NYG60492.1 alkylated DNA nucleotide flippase Atl1 [Nocardioides daedukensis]
MAEPTPAEEYAEAVLRVAESVPRGRVTTYGAIAEAVGAALGRGGPRVVGNVMAREGAAVPWWRVVRADGSLGCSRGSDAHQNWLAEGTPLRRSGAVDVAAAFWRPPPLAQAPTDAPSDVSGEALSVPDDGIGS